MGYLQDGNGGGVKSTVEHVSRIRAVHFHSNLSSSYMRNRLGSYQAKKSVQASGLQKGFCDPSALFGGLLLASVESSCRHGVRRGQSSLASRLQCPY
jgi:hypothetical protein